MAIRGDITQTPPGIPGGNETFFDFGPPAIDGVGVTVADLGAQHGNDSQSVAGTTDTTTSKLSRTFGFDSADTSDLSVDVYIHAILEGDLFADNFSSASARGMFEIRDSDDNLIGMDAAFVEVNALANQIATADVFEVLTLAVSLTPGEMYAIDSTLTLSTQAGLNGAARALFADTFAYEISGLEENPFGEPGSGTTFDEFGPGPPFGVPEPSTFALGILGLLMLGIRGRRRRRRA
ncbi:MAG: PEP-CTERM sorting domain-containing protein [Planctomycetales bacterium]|nr:PEP-CTERM sorting domain-containing protein [Planctomycetales bacterium]NIP70652.1 PEP-CTERM sorting domain-containing protein [Planctomycetales bacterium]